MIEITFTGETLLDLAEQAQNFIAFVMPAATAVTTAVKDKVGKAKGRGTGKLPRDPVADAKATADEIAAAAGHVPTDTKTLEKTKEAALDMLRKVYCLGEDGQKAVHAVVATFGVKKSGDVPIEKADELLAAAKKLVETTTEDAPV